jgi:hypothetical protein
MPGTTKQFYLHGILLPGSVWIGELTDTTPAANVTFLDGFAAGSAVVPSFRGGQGATPDISFTSPQLKTILDQCGMTGLDCSASQIDLFYRKAKILDTREAIASAAHLRVRAKRCLLYWTSIQAQQGQPATISCRIVPTFDGTNDPLVGLGSQAIAANLLAEQHFTLGPVKLNGSWVDGVQGWNLDLGVQLNEKQSDGQTYPTFVGVRQHNPVLTVTTPDADYWASPGVAGTAVTALLAYLRKKDDDATGNLTDVTASHIQFSNAENPAGLATVENSTGGIDDEASLDLRIGLRISSANTAHPLAVNTAIAIS